jgi:hypothetical protein
MTVVRSGPKTGKPIEEGAMEWRSFSFGLAIGLVIAIGVYIYQERKSDAAIAAIRSSERVTGVSGSHSVDER